MNDFDKIFGKTLQAKPEAELFVEQNKIDQFYKELWEDPDIIDLVTQKSDYVRARLGRMIELLPPSFTTKVLRLKTISASIGKTHICIVVEKHFTTHMWRIFHESQILLGEGVYLNFVMYALKEGVIADNEQVMENARSIIENISYDFETAVIRYLIAPYCDTTNPRRAPQELIDYLRKLMIEDYKFAKKVLEGYEKGRIFIGK